MSDSTPSFFANLPGFDFLKSLSSAQTASLNPWLKPTLDPKELDQRIQELKTVHFWLEQNAKALSATIQALEVQRMTLSTLQQMNVDWKTALQPKKSASRAGSKTETAQAAEAHDAGEPTAAQAGAGPEAMRLWTNLASQFGQIAQQSMTDMQRRAQEAVTAVGERVSKTAAHSSAGAKSKADKPATAARKSPAAKHTRTRARKS
ncbi:MAG: hypothetical protein RL307_612 [Pseudomonadota bacterium]